MNEEKLLKGLYSKVDEIRTIIDTYADKFTRKPMLSKKEKEHLVEDIEYMQKASKHKYTHIEHTQTIDCLWMEVRFHYISHTYEHKWDTIAGSPCYTQKMEKGQMYPIYELIEEPLLYD